MLTPTLCDRQTRNGFVYPSDNTIPPPKPKWPLEIAKEDEGKREEYC